MYKTDAFLEAQPYGNVPAGFVGGGRVGVFESNSIMRAAARAGDACPELYGPDWPTQSRVDSFLDRTLLFADVIQPYLLAGRSGIDASIHASMREAFDAYLVGIEAALERSRYVATDHLTLADIVFVCEIALLSNEVALGDALAAFGAKPILTGMSAFPRAAAHLKSFASEEEFSADLEDYFERLAHHDWW